MVSGASDGEGVEVVGQDAPGDPGAGAVVAFEAAALEAVAALEVADAALGADAVARQAAVAASGPGALAASDKRAVGRRQMLGDRAGREAAVNGDLACSDGKPVELGAGGGQQVGLVWGPDL